MFNLVSNTKGNAVGGFMSSKEITLKETVIIDRNYF